MHLHTWLTYNIFVSPTMQLLSISFLALASASHQSELRVYVFMGCGYFP